MKIVFGDLEYLSDDNYKRAIPLNAGYISSYLLKHMPVKIKIFKDPNKLIDSIAENCPDVLALTFYVWNCNLILAVAKHCKKNNPNLKIILGGPNFKPDDSKWIEKFFISNPYIDLFIVKEGEYSFFKCIELLEKNKLDLKKSDHSNWPTTFFSYDFSHKKIINNPNNPIDRLELTDIPSPYLNGILDEFLQDEHLAPIIETNRGCPYGCSFCFWAQATLTKLRRFNLDTIKEEIRYISERTKNPTKLLYIADANFGILKRDSEIADTLMECKEKYDFPKRLFIYSLKNQTMQSISTFEKIKTIANMSMSMESVNEKTLYDVGRKNIPIHNYARNRMECEKRGITTYAELIYGMPHETLDSFMDGVSTLLKAGQERIQMYALQIIWGAEMSSKEYIKKFGFETRFRYLPHYCGTHHGMSTSEYEEIVVKTNTMSFDDFLKIRDFHFLILLLGSKNFKEFQRILKCTELDIVEITKLILKEEALWPTRFKNIVSELRKACKQELLHEKDVKKEIKEAEVKKLKDTEMFLAPSAVCKLFAKQENIVEFFNYLSELVRRNLSQKISEEMIEEIITSLNFSMDRTVSYDNLNNNVEVQYRYDIDAWLNSETPERLSKFKTKNNIMYNLKLADGLEDAYKKAKNASSSIEESVYLLKFNYFPLSDDRIFSYIRSKN